MTQAFNGNGYVQTIVSGQVTEFADHYRSAAAPPVDLVLRTRFNPNLKQAWFGGVMEVTTTSPCCRSFSPAPC